MIGMRQTGYLVCDNDYAFTAKGRTKQTMPEQTRPDYAGLCQTEHLHQFKQSILIPTSHDAAFYERSTWKQADVTHPQHETCD